MKFTMTYTFSIPESIFPTKPHHLVKQWAEKVKLGSPEKKQQELWSKHRVYLTVS